MPRNYRQEERRCVQRRKMAAENVGGNRVTARPSVRRANYFFLGRVRVARLCFACNVGSDGVQLLVLTTDVAVQQLLRLIVIAK